MGGDQQHLQCESLFCELRFKRPLLYLFWAICKLLLCENRLGVKPDEPVESFPNPFVLPKMIWIFIILSFVVKLRSGAALLRKPLISQNQKHIAQKCFSKLFYFGFRIPLFCLSAENTASLRDISVCRTCFVSVSGLLNLRAYPSRCSTWWGIRVPSPCHAWWCTTAWATPRTRCCRTARSTPETSRTSGRCVTKLEATGQMETTWRFGVCPCASMRNAVCSRARR